MAWGGGQCRGKITAAMSVWQQRISRHSEIERVRGAVFRPLPYTAYLNPEACFAQEF